MRIKKDDYPLGPAAKFLMVIPSLLVVSCTLEDSKTESEAETPNILQTGDTGIPAKTDPEAGNGGTGSHPDSRDIVRADSGTEDIGKSIGYCGNGKIDPSSEEECDRDDLGGASCTSLSLGDGRLSCSQNCFFDTTGCDQGSVGPDDNDSLGPGDYHGAVDDGAGGSPAHTGDTESTALSPDCLDGIETYNSDGPFTYRSEKWGAINAYIPDLPTGCKIPMVHYSNGTFGTCMFYESILRRLATNGFFTLCYESMYTGAGSYGIEAFQMALSEYPDLIDQRIGSAGHSQGGMAAFNTLAYVENEWGDQGIYSALPMEPASGYGTNPAEGWQALYASINSPVFMFSGLATDTLVSQGWVQLAFDTLDDATEAYFYTKSGANHIGTISRDGSEVVVSWFRWTLLGDSKACEYFKALPNTDPSWALADSQNERPCN